MQLVRHPVVAGAFYDHNEDQLKRNLDKLFFGTKEGKNRMVVSPHAGYVYSGKTAAFAIASMKPAKKFIILGPNHTGLGPEFSVMSSGYWETPLGKVKIDTELAGKLKSFNFLEEDHLAHSQEHSIEVQLPFLQHKFRDFTFVPVCIMNTSYSEDFLKKCKELGSIIAGLAGKEDIGVIASSDFSHYLPQNVADMKDGAAIEEIEHLDIKGFFRKLEEVDASVCGYGPIATAMSAAKQLKMKPKLIKKSSSGDVTGDHEQVVAYYAIGFS